MKKSRRKKNNEDKFDFIEEYARAAEEADKQREAMDEDAAAEAETGEADTEVESTSDDADAKAETEAEADAEAEAEEVAADVEADTEAAADVEADANAKPDEPPVSESKAETANTDAEQEDDPDYEDTPEYRREMRHKRRVRNQIIAYTALIVVLAILATGIGIGVHALVGVVNEKKAQQLAAEEEAAQAQALAEQEALTVEAPDTVTEQAEAMEEAYAEENEPVEEVDYLEEMVTSTISQMPIEDKVAQLFMVTPEALTGVGAATRAGDGTRDALVQYAVGGLIYDRKNLESEEQLLELLDNTKNMSKYELFLGIKEAGGENCVLSGSSLSEIPVIDSPKTIAESGDAANAYNAGVTMSSYMSYFGFNLNLAPNGSLTSDEASVSADDCYGSDEVAACEMITQMIGGLSTGKIAACMTDFPGTGNITLNTADERVESEISAEELSAQIVPYITGTTAGAGLIQTNNVAYITADSSHMPASLSEYVISKTLRGDMAFGGVVVTGPLNEKAITESYSSAEAAMFALTAGADIIYMPENFEEAYNAILEAVSSGTISESRIDESLDRIYRVKFAGYVE
ncbi:MAG: beta-N-acetylhexosaminidase [Lachnospiraceae bacterium]|nr:beta-N-acetylhexosaminidase [Lachnospiraceae bacterium]